MGDKHSKDASCGGDGGGGGGASPDDFTETVVCMDDDLHEGQMTEVEVNGKKLLLLRDRGVVRALSSKCSHYGAPLVTGVLYEGRVRCPWHGACFSVETGDIEDFPGVDCLQTYDVLVNGKSEVLVRMKKSVTEDKRVRVKCKPDKSDKRTFLIIGAGASGFQCVQTLRQNGFSGEIVMVTKEDFFPYDRPKLSKALDSAAETLLLRQPLDYETYGVKVLRQTEVNAVDFKKKLATLSNGTSISFSKALIATGGRPQTLDIRGKELENIFVLRTVKDGNAIAKQANGKNVVVVGTSFIGLEVAGYLSDKASSVTVVGRSSVPLDSSLGPELGLVAQQLLEEKGVKFILKNSPKEFLGVDGRISRVRLQDEREIEADVCLLGIGVRPATEFLRGSDLSMSSDGYILVDKHMKTCVDDVFAAGDVVRFPLFLNDNAHSNVQHWQMALMQGKVAGENMASRETGMEEIQSVPFFWTVICGKSIRYAGFGHGYDDLVIHGDLRGQKFVAFYTRGDRVVAVASMNFDPVVAQAAEMMRANMVITKTEILADALGWTKRLMKYTHL